MQHTKDHGIGNFGAPLTFAGGTLSDGTRYTVGLTPADAPTFAFGLQYIGARHEPGPVNLAPGQGFRYAGPPIVAVGFGSTPV
jgi:hypothetical protein